MRTSFSRFVCVALLLVLGDSAGFGWGTLTHVYFANNLGVMVGPRNQNEIYGAVLPDMFGYDFTPSGQTDQDELAGFNIAAEIPVEFALDQNYPNPFNPTTNIEYAVPSDGRATLTIYNSLGQEVATLVDDNMTAGRYVVTWDAEGIAGGTYFYRLQAGNSVLTKKMVLLK
jgi:hypothetical protein